MVGWMDEWMERWMDGWKDGWVDEWMEGWMDGNGEMDGWMDGWMAGWQAGRWQVWAPFMYSHLLSSSMSWWSVALANGWSVALDECEYFPYLWAQQTVLVSVALNPGSIGGPMAGDYIKKNRVTQSTDASGLRASRYT